MPGAGAKRPRVSHKNSLGRKHLDGCLETFGLLANRGAAKTIAIVIQIRLQLIRAETHSLPRLVNKNVSKDFSPHSANLRQRFCTLGSMRERRGNY